MAKPTGGYPRPHAVLYVLPNPDSTRKSCSNCPMWVSQSNRCTIHGPDQEVQRDDVCGYHVFGMPVPSHKWPPKPQGGYPKGTWVTPKFSGLEHVPGGTSCDTCRYYIAKGLAGLCNKVAGADGQQAKVEALGCCAAWERGRRLVEKIVGMNPGNPY